ncbi:MAG: hypothetical protein NUV63_06495 [Gallionella sp.]|nr:hypothetical protein [Gallionella sp.]
MAMVLVPSMVTAGVEVSSLMEDQGCYRIYLELGSYFHSHHRHSNFYIEPMQSPNMLKQKTKQSTVSFSFKPPINILILSGSYIAIANTSAPCGTMHLFKLKVYALTILPSIISAKTVLKVSSWHRVAHHSC